MADRAAFVDDSGETRLSGELFYPGSTADDVLTVQADGSIAAASVSSPAFGHATYGGNNVSVPNTGVAALLTWDTLVEGSALLDLSDPTLPTFVTEGVYAVTVTTVPGSQMTDGKAYVFSLGSNTGPVPLVQHTVAVEDSVDFDPAVTLTLLYFFTAGSRLSVQVQQADSGSINFALTAYIQQLA